MIPIPFFRFAIALAALPVAFATAQVTWTPRLILNDTLGAADRTPRIQFFGADTGWALTPGGQLLKTRNGGTDWATAQGPAGDLRAISFLGPDTGWVLTVRDTQARDSDTTIVYDLKFLYAARTVDGGATWESGGRMPRNAHVAGPYSVHFVTPDTGWVITGWAPFFKTTNGGQTWREAFGDQNGGYKGHVSRSGMIWSITNRSIIKLDSVTAALNNRRGNWAEVVAFPQPRITHAVFFADSNRGWYAGNEGVVRRTDDQGKTWTASGNTGTFGAWHVLHFTDRDTGWVFGDGGAARRSVNGGDSWTGFSLPTPERIVAAEFHDTRTAWIMDANGSIFKTENANAPVSLRGGPGAAAWDHETPSLNGSTLRYELNRAARITVALRAIDGTRVAVLADGIRPAGAHALDLVVPGIAPGVHVLTFERDGKRSVKTIFIP